MKKTEGYVTDDGTFFENHLEAALHEAESKLRERLVTAFPQVDIEKFIAIVFEVMPQLWSYIHAHNTATAAKRDQQAEEPDRVEAQHGGEAKVDGGIGHVSSTEEDLASLLKLPPRGPSHVSNVGSGPRTKKIPERRAKHGT
jgi:hypothetical protein